MGVLNSLTPTEQYKEQAAMDLREKVIAQGATIFDDNEFYRENYSQLANLFESDSQDMQYKGGITLMMLDRVQNYMSNMIEMYGEATVQTSLGTPPKRVLDVVRIFYPNQIATELVDIQPIDNQVGSIFTMTPRFTDAVPGVTAGDEVFKTTPTYFNYASEELTESLGTGNGILLNFTSTLGNTPVRPNSVTVIATVSAATVTATDDGSGNLTGTGVTGTIDYATGDVDITYTDEPDDTTDVSITYCYDSEVSEDSIREFEVDIDLTPVKAKIHPVKFKYSVAAGFAAQSALQIDVQDTLAQLSGQYIKVERDDKLVALIDANATSDSNLNFNADASSLAYDKRSFYGEIEIKLDEAEAQIQFANGRGGVDWVLCGRNAANIFRNSKGFQSTPTVAPIGAHVIGTLRDGTVTVVKSLKLDANTFIFGYKGYMAGDSATILAEWIPIYFTPVHQSETLTNRQGVMSMYDLFVNNAGYYRKGVVSNYAA